MQWKNHQLRGWSDKWCMEILVLVNMLASSHNAGIGCVEDRCGWLANGAGPGNRRISV